MFKKFAALAVAGLAIAAAATPSYAIDQEGKWEVTLLGSGTSDKDFDNGGFAFNGTLNYYFTDQFSVGVRQGASYQDVSGSDDVWQGQTRVGAFYHFNYDETQRWVPYIGANIGYIYGDNVSDTWVAGPEAGLKFFVNDTTFISGSVGYEFLFDDGDSAEDNIDDGQFFYSLGIGFQF
jgi:hypothetical protein